MCYFLYSSTPFCSCYRVFVYYSNMFPIFIIVFCFCLYLFVMLPKFYGETRKRDKAQRVARTACANATVHFLLTCRLDMLLPPSEWPLKTSAKRILAYVPSPSMQMSHTISRVTGPKFTKFVSVVNFFIGGVNATIRVAIRSPVVEKEGRHLKKSNISKTQSRRWHRDAGRANKRFRSNISATEYFSLESQRHTYNAAVSAVDLREARSRHSPNSEGVGRFPPRRQAQSIHFCNSNLNPFMPKFPKRGQWPGDSMLQAG